MNDLPSAASPRATITPEPGREDPLQGARKKPIRSFVIRHGRQSPAQKHAREVFAPQYGIVFAREPLDFPAAFGRVAPTVLEIGFGMGETTAVMAACHPEQNYLAIEVHQPGVGALFKRIDAMGLTNIRIIEHDAIEVLDHMIAPGSLTGVHLYFPDPWPKKRHHKRRIINVGLLDRVSVALAPTGYFHMATDWAPYAEEALAALTADGRYENTAEQFAPRPAWRPLTKFEQRGMRLGHGVWDLLFRRRPGVIP